MKKLVLLASVLFSIGSFAQTKESVEKCAAEKERNTGTIERVVVPKKVREKVYIRDCYVEQKKANRERKKSGKKN